MKGPMPRQLTPEQALKLIGDVCRVQGDNIAASKAIVDNWYATQPHPTTGNAVQVDKRILNQMAEALERCLDVSDTTVNL